jgi:hypothetical protein
MNAPILCEMTVTNSFARGWGELGFSGWHTNLIYLLFLEIVPTIGREYSQLAQDHLGHLPSDEVRRRLTVARVRVGSDGIVRHPQFLRAVDSAA